MSDPPLHPPPAAVMTELERERQMAIFVMKYFLPAEQLEKVTVEFIRQQLSRSHIEPQFPIRIYSVTNSRFDENSDDWKDLMEWSNPSLLDQIESQRVHLFQWVRTFRYLTELRASLDGKVVRKEKFEMQKKVICKFMQQMQHQKRGERRLGLNVFWILWRLRRFLAIIPMPETPVSRWIVNQSLLRFQAEMGLVPCHKVNQMMIHNPELFLLYLVTACWLSAPPAQSQSQAQAQAQAQMQH